ncbi:MAG TPA: C39 family peptidase [Bacteroidales bacterium]|nr:C39 family peptidase [Bacteroidales bacterium]HPI30052.1 C39 family peptidase [Bacteroidales bacterium]
MKKHRYFFCALLLCALTTVVTGAYSQNSFSALSGVTTGNKIDHYKAETEGYFVCPVNTSKGIVLSNNFASKLYLIDDENLVELVSAPGCGRYFTLSADRSAVGFKLIRQNGMQVPAIYDLNAMKVIELSAPVDLCGQVSFSNNGKIVYTVGNNLCVVQNGNVSQFPLGTYTNIAPVSPDGNFVIFNNDADQLLMINLATGQITQITDNAQGYMYPKWSPDGDKVAFSTLAGTIKVWVKSSGTFYTIGTGANYTWSDDSQWIIYNVVTASDFEFLGSEIFKSRFDGTAVAQLTHTPGTHEMYPAFGSAGTFIYSTYNRREIARSPLSTGVAQKQITSVLVRSEAPLPLDTLGPDDFSQKKSKANTMVAGDVPYCHQVYDTPTWHSGWWSCAPTTAIMALAYFNRLPKWPTTVNHGKSWDPHTSNYGSYVADRYRFREVYYETTSDDYAGNTSYGGYGYMWGLGSPSSYMDNYFQNHGMTSVRSSSTTFTNVQTEINNNYPFSICSTITSAGHLTLAVGYVNGQHTIIYNDPYGNKNNGYPNYYGKNSYYDWPGYNNGYQNINSMAWSASSETTQPTYSNTIIDDNHYDHGFYIYNQGVSHMRYFRDNISGGYNGHFWWTYTSAATTLDTCYVTWTPTLTNTGYYTVSAYVPNSTNVTATTARYKVYYSGGSTTVIKNQATQLGQWVSLGSFLFNPANQHYVRVGDGSGILGQKVAFDAVKWVCTVPATAGTISGSTTVCQGQTSVTYTVPAIANSTSYSWTLPTGATGTSTTNSITVNYGTSAVSGTITVRGVNSCGTNGTAASLSITVNPLPVAAGTITGSATVCQGQTSVTYTVPAITNATSYVWTLPTGATGTSTTNSITVNFGTSAVSGTITVKGHNNCGDGTAASKAVTVNPLPVAAGTIAGSATVCQGQTSVTYTVPAITNATSYVWTLPTGVTGTSTTNSITVDFGLSAVSGTITVKGHNDCGDGIVASKSITVNPLPVTAGTISGSATVCQGQTAVTYTVPAITNATSYVWTLPTGATGTSTTNSITVDFGLSAVSGTVTVKGHNDCGDGVAASQSITVNPLPVAAGTISGSATVCQGQTAATYTVPAITNATSYVWTLPTGVTGASTSNSITVDFGLSAVSGTITVKGHNDCGDGVADSMAITINPLPAAPTASTTIEYCQGELSAPLTAAGNNLMWYSLPAGGTGSAVAPTPSTIVADTVHYYVSQNVDGCESSRTDIMVTILAIPGTPTIVIAYHDLISDAQDGNQWYGPNGLIAGADSSVYSPVSEGSYYVIVTQNGCSSDTSNVVEFVFSGMESHQGESAIRLYPNPVSDELILEMDGNKEPVDFVIYNSFGAEVYKGVLLHQTQVRTGNFAQGVYLIKIDGVKAVEFRKIVKK